MLIHPVSILARPEGRALLALLLPGALEDVVSILARPEGRALHRGAGVCPHCYGFNPRPPRRTGATGAVGLNDE